MFRRYRLLRDVFKFVSHYKAALLTERLKNLMVRRFDASSKMYLWLFSCVLPVVGDCKVNKIEKKKIYICDFKKKRCISLASLK